MILTKEAIQEKFSDIEFFEEGHRYIRNGKEYLSATTFIHQYEEPFPESQAARTAEKFGMEEHEVQAVWDFLNNASTLVGTPFHEMNENFYNSIIDGKPEEYGLMTERLSSFAKDYERFFDDTKMLDDTLKLGKKIPMADRMSVLQSHFRKFHEDTKDVLVPIATEIRVYSDPHLLSGTFDQLFWSLKTKKHHVFDWKNNKRFRRYCRWGNKLLHPLDYLDQCEYMLYSLQLTLYRKILQAAFPEAEFGDNIIVWFFEENPSYEAIKLPYMEKEIDMIMEIRRQQIAEAE